MMNQTFPKMSNKDWANLFLGNDRRILRDSEEMLARHEDPKDPFEDPYYETRKASVERQHQAFRKRQAEIDAMTGDDLVEY
jgi:hypothetical protein